MNRLRIGRSEPRVSACPARGRLLFENFDLIQTQVKSVHSCHNKNHRSAILPKIVLYLWLFPISACSYFSPEYTRPDTPVKKSWVRHVPENVSVVETIRPDWWSNFGDPYLNDLVAIAINQNYDLKILAARTGVAQATIGQVNAARLPTVEGAFGARFIKAPGRDLQKSYSYALGLSWEIDIWGKIQKSVEAQEAEVQATEADWRAGYLEIVSGVAEIYFQIRLLDEQIQQQKSSVAANQRILDIQQAMLKEGLIEEKDVNWQISQVKGFEQGLKELERVRALAENRLATILGIPAGDLKVPPGSLRGAVHLVDLPLGLPMDLLLRRPDVIAAEFRVLQVHNLISEARRGLLPTVSITGKGGISSIKLTDLSKAFTYGLDPSIELPFLDPNVYARIDVTEAEVNVVKEEYRRTVLNAFEEVENALVSLASHKSQKADLEEQLKNLQKVAGTHRAELTEGEISELEVLSSERDLLSTEQQLSRNHQDILIDTIELYKALGGGWPKQEIKEAS
jgi:NodT family efflux transporter outer membrane factor (OMF) lipoprotein